MAENTITSTYINKEGPFGTISFEHATKNQRFFNYLIDYAISYGLNFPVIFMFAYFMASATTSFESVMSYLTNFLFLQLLSFINLLVYYFLFEGLTHGYTIGKLITGTRAVKENITPITWGDAFIRTLCRMIPFDPITAMAGFPLHDRLSKTYVIKKASIIK
ncbi:MAG: hypothetical protein K0Q79_41 [Flavipsychrobacter sp.]|jgi:uncharacterized RDD family membrane protein YckC|nr:hypothetical protein [Flavipsychrobacter sp.]